MKERPILFSAPMVRAILDGTKTQTRRVVKCSWLDQIQEPKFGFTQATPDRHISVQGYWPSVEFGESFIKCPYGQVGDQLWVRETACFTVDDASFEPPYDGAVEREFKANGTRFAENEGWIIYRASDPNPDLDSDSPVWTPSIFMPRWASRIDLLVKTVRVERLQSISEDDALEEGVRPEIESKGCTNTFNRINWRPIQAYRDLWKTINGVGSWDLNPWVFVVEFERLNP